MAAKKSAPSGPKKPSAPLTYEACQKQFASLPQLGEEFGEAGQAQISRVMRMAIQLPPTPDKVREFALSGWPALVEMAKEEGKTPNEIIQEVYDLMHFVNRNTSNDVQFLQAIKAGSRGVEGPTKWLTLQPLFSDFDEVVKLKPRELQAVDAVQDGISSLATFAAGLELDIYKVSTVNYALPVNGQTLRHIFRAIDDLGEEATLIQVIRESKAKQKTVIASSPQEPKPGNLIPDAAPEKPAAVEDPVKSTFLAPTQVAQKPPENVGPVPLIDYLTSDSPLIEGRVYAFNNAHHGEYSIQFERDVIKEAEKGRDRTVKRLLSTLFIGDGQRGGLKMLASLGKNIVEVKAVMRGHWRLIGCLEGHSIVIKKLLDMPVTKAGYAKMIDSDLCEK